jgi:hypothetical protein
VIVYRLKERKYSLMLVFGANLIIALLVAAGSYVFFKDTFTTKEFALHVVISIVVAGGTVGIIYYQNTSDTEMWNGRVSKKYRETVPCSHSYSCDCHTTCSGSGKNRTCTEYCDTCYRHYRGSRKIRGNDYNWVVKTTNNEKLKIARIDSQGVKEPPRWTKVILGEPTSVPHHFVNYLKANPDTILRQKGHLEKFPDVPEHPKVYDYYRARRVIPYGISVTDLNAWDTALDNINADLGSKKQVNMILLLSKNKPYEYVYAVEEKWIGGKKNEAILFINTDSDGKIDWAKVVSWSKEKRFDVQLESDIHDLETLSINGVMGAIRTNISKNFVRRPMEEYKFLAARVTPTTTQWVIALILNLAISIGVGVVLHREDLFN